LLSDDSFHVRQKPIPEAAAQAESRVRDTALPENRAGSMKIKSYFAQTVADAIWQASQELGPDAMLLNSRRATVESRHLGEYEVVFGLEASAGAATAAPSPEPDLPAVPASDRFAAKLSELTHDLEAMRRALTRTAFEPSQWLGASPDACDAYGLLTAAEVAPDLAKEIVQCTGVRFGGPAAALSAGFRTGNAPGFRQALIDELESRFSVEPALGRGDARPRITALVGPPGSGKTTTLVKLAIQHGLASRRPAVLLSTDTYRVAAAEQLRSYAAILGIGFQVIETLNALAQAIDENRGKDLILIDTPGYSAGDMDSAAPLAGFLGSHTNIDTQLVLPCSMKSCDLARATARFEVFRPKRLLFTKLDETGSFGPVFAEAARVGLPISFFTSGQRIPEDIEAASRARVVELLLGGDGVQSRQAA
jgi:flagellar biosynthesis protein FlhF